MSWNIPITQGQHDWEKQNLVTLRVNGKPADRMKCKKCGITGNRFRLDMIAIDGRYSQNNAEMCRGEKRTSRIKITNFRGHGRQFANLINGSEHDIIPTPPGQKADNGIWVNGVSEPVKVLFGEFEFIKK